MLAAREDLVDRISEVAKRKGLTLFSMINDLLEMALEVNEMGMSLEELLEVYRVVKSARKIGFTLVLESLLYDLAELAYREAREEMLKKSFEAGFWLAKRYAASSPDPISEFEKDLKEFTWNVSELTIEKLERKLSINILGPRLPEPYVALLASFIEGALKAFSYDVVEKETSRGILRIEAFRKDANV